MEDEEEGGGVEFVFDGDVEVRVAIQFPIPPDAQPLQTAAPGEPVLELMMKFVHLPRLPPPATDRCPRERS